MKSLSKCQSSVQLPVSVARFSHIGRDIWSNLATLLPIPFCNLHTKLPKVYKYIFFTHCWNILVPLNALDISTCLLIIRIIKTHLFKMSAEVLFHRCCQ